MPKDKSEKLIEAQWVQIDADTQYKENLRQLELDHRLFKLLKNIKVSLLNYLNARGELICHDNKHNIQISQGKLSEKVLDELLELNPKLHANRLDEDELSQTYGFWLEKDISFQIWSWFRDDKLTSERVNIALNLYQFVDRLYNFLDKKHKTENLNHSDELEKLMEQLILSFKDNVLLHAKKEYTKSHYSHISGSRLLGGKGTWFQSHLDNCIIKAIEVSEISVHDKTFIPID